MPRYKLTIEYDGTPFVGWQIQGEGASVQGALGTALAAFCGHPVKVAGAGRTDAGVHALGQVAHVDLAKDWRADRVRDAVNAHLRPHPVAVVAAEKVAETFDARFSARQRHDVYRIANRRADLALDRLRAWRVPRKLDAAAMHAAAQRLVGKHDFTTFRSAECQAKSPVKTLDQLDVVRAGDDVRIETSARSFLHNQVRSMVGSLVQVGDGKWSGADLAAALAARDRARCGPVAPPEGLIWCVSIIEVRMISRRLMLSALWLPLAAEAARAQAFPSGQVRIVVPFPPGGATDVLGRVLATQLQALWGQTVISDYRPGAAGLIGTRQVIAAPADGHTLLMASTGAILALAAGQSSFDVTRELSPISLIAAPPYIVVANPAVPARSTAELIAHAKANPGKLSFGSSGAGSASHLSGALFAQMAGIEMLHVPYRGTGPAVTDLLGGRIDLMFSPALVVTPHIAAGTLRVIGVTGAARSALFPDFPTIAETGLAGYQSLGWFGLFAPAGTAREIVVKVSADVGRVLALPEAKQRLAEQGAEPAPNTPEAFTAFVNTDVAKWLELAAKAGIKLSP